MTKKRADRGDGRDAKGRWVNISGNPNGRPPRVPDLDMSDVYNFSQCPTEITISGEKQLMTRHETVMFKLYESAMKGRITSIRILLEKFEQAELSKEFVQLEFQKWAELMAEDPRSVPPEVERWMKMVIVSREPRRSNIRTRRSGKLKQD